MESGRHGRIVIVSGPSGVGKTTICDQLLKLPNFVRSISATTRVPRAGERHDIDYMFMNKAAFENAANEGYFLEWALVYGNYYGTPRSHVEEKLRQGKNVVLNIDVQGAEQVRRSTLPVVSFFLKPPSMEVLRERIARRADGTSDIDRRMKAAEVEMSRAVDYDFRITNDEIGRTVQNIVECLEQLDSERETSEAQEG